ncbi:unnamed protein product, partial [marine sediment metagenome]
MLHTHFAQLVHLFIDKLPLAGSLPWDKILEFITFMTENFQENYDASYTVTYRQQTICDL